MQNLGRKLEIFVIVAVIAAIGVVYAFKQHPEPVTDSSNQSDISTNNPASDMGGPNMETSVKPSDDSTAPADSVLPTIITYQGVSGKNALQLLTASHQVESQHYSFGDLVTSIDGIKPDSQHFWAMYVNDQFSQVGASAYQTKSTDTIRWEVDAVVDTTK